MLRQKLRTETSAIHARLHLHPGLSAAASGTIDVASYRALLMRLYGFHRAFEQRMEGIAGLDTVRPRSGLLADDLATLGVARDQREALRLCETLSAPINHAEALGALYVVEGSALGGAQIGLALSRALPALDGAGYRFFSNDGAPRGAWRNLLARLDAIYDPLEERAAIGAAVATFRAFEDWMKDWRISAAAPERMA